jgi:predicted nucleic acid-binding Zn ribbon protein
MIQHLAEILSRMERGAGRAIEVCRSLDLWKEVVDERVGKNAEATKITNRTLYLSVSSPAWAQELSFLKKEIIERFNKRAGSEVINDIRFKAGNG